MYKSPLKLRVQWLSDGKYFTVLAHFQSRHIKLLRPSRRRKIKKYRGDASFRRDAHKDAHRGPSFGTNCITSDRSGFKTSAPK